MGKLTGKHSLVANTPIGHPYFHNREKFETLKLFVIMLIFLGAALYLIWGIPPILDELGHIFQIKEFVHGNLWPTDFVATGPGYHIIMAGIAKVIGNWNDDALRLYSTCLSFICIYLYYLTNRQISTNSNLIRTLQFAMLPVIFPYFVMVYTDILALFFILLCYYQQLKQKPLLAGVFALLAVITRQTNIVWIGMLFALGYYADNKLSFSYTLIKSHFIKYWTYILLLVLFIFFVFLNGNIVLGGQKGAQPIIFQFNNIYFLLILYFVMFLPMIALDFQKIFLLMKNKHILLLILILFVVYCLTFNSFHIWNVYTFNFVLLRNLIIRSIVFGNYKLLYFIPILFSIMHLFIISKSNLRLYCVYITSFFLLSFICLIEPRYYINTFAFFCLFKDYRETKFEIVQTIYLAVLSILLMYINTHYHCVL
jgi:alpha-1,2-glucosyltransferase